MTRFNGALRMSASILALAAGAGATGAYAQSLTITGNRTGVAVNAPVAGDLIIAGDANITPDGVMITAAIAGDVTNNGVINTVFELDDSVTVGGGIVSSAVVGGDFSNAGTISSTTGSTDGDVQTLDAKGSEGLLSTTTAGSSSYGVFLPFTTGTASNSGDIGAESSASVTSSADLTAEDAASAVAIGEAASLAQGLVGTFSEGINNTADGTVTASANTNADLTAYAAADATEARITGNLTTGSVGLLIGPTASLTNDGGISSSAISNILADLSSVAGADSASGTVSLSAVASAVGVNGFTGGLDKLTNTGTISADASASVTSTNNATSDESQGSLYTGNTTVSADAVGASMGTGDAGPFVNSGQILAKSGAVFDQTNVISAASEAYFSGNNNDISAQASSLPASVTLSGFSNTGTISASATSEASNVIALDGNLGAEADVSTSVSATGGAGYILNLKGDGTNSGIISSSIGAANTLSVDAKAAEGLADIDISDYTGAFAGQDIGNLEGTFVNDAKGKISGDATASGVHTLNAAGQDAEVSTYLLTEADSYGFSIGALSDAPYTFKNAGAISSAANASETFSAVAQATDGSASVFLGNVGVEAEAEGFDGTDTITAFDNSGTISGQASAVLSQTLSATGSAGSSVYALNQLEVIAAGASISMEGNAANSGEISANAIGKLEQTIVSGTAAAPGLLSVVNILEVDAIGLAGVFVAPPVDPEDEEADPVAYTFTNSGKITASADLQVTSAVTGGTGTEDEGFGTVGLLRAYGAEIWGEAGITNSGEIAAKGNVSLVGAGDTEVFAEIVGLSLPDITAGGEVINSGKITADLTGAGAEGGAVVALLLGPLEENTLAAAVTGTSQSTDTQVYTTTATDVITVTNSGTIAATNSQGPSVGIGALFTDAPVVINQQGGSISGDIAIGIDQGNADTLNWTGGEIHGVVEADALDVVNVFAGTGTPASKTVSAGADFALTGGASLNIGVKDAPVTFALDGSVSGTAAVNVNDDGNLRLGPSATVDAGTFVMGPEATLTVEFDRDSAGSIKTTGDVAIDGKLVAVALPDLYGDKGSHTIIEAGGEVTGAFDNVSITGDTLLLDFSAITGEKTVTVAWERTAFDEVDGLSENSAAVAGALEDGYDPARPASKNTPELNDQLKGLFTITDAGLYDRVLNSWSGSEHAQVMRAATNLSEPYLMAIGEHLNDNRNSGFREQNVVMLRPKGSSNAIAPASSVGASAAEETGFAVWGRAFGRWADTRGDANADGFDEDTYGAVLGVDFQVTPTILLGIAGSYTNDDIGFDDGDDAEIERWTIGGYASATFDAFYLDASFTYASDDYEVNRTIVTGGVACLAYNCSTGAASKYEGDGLIVHAEAGFNWVLGEGVRLQPFAGLNYTGMDTDAFGEVGGGDLGLQVLDGTGKSFQSRLGARLSGEWGDGDIKWVPELRAEWRHEFEDQPAWIVSNLVGLPNDPFLTVGSHVSGDLAVIGAGITAQMANGWGLYLDYQGAFASGYSSHAIQGGARFRF